MLGDPGHHCSHLLREDTVGYGLASRVAGYRITDSHTPHSTHVVSRQSGETGR
jgi:hypothetical protein